MLKEKNLVFGEMLRLLWFLLVFIQPCIPVENISIKMIMRRPSELCLRVFFLLFDLNAKIRDLNNVILFERPLDGQI